MAILLYVSKKGDWSGWIGDTPETVMITRATTELDKKKATLRKYMSKQSYWHWHFSF